MGPMNLGLTSTQWREREREERKHPVRRPHHFVFEGLEPDTCYDSNSNTNSNTNRNSSSSSSSSSSDNNDNNNNNDMTVYTLILLYSRCYAVFLSNVCQDDLDRRVARFKTLPTEAL